MNDNPDRRQTLAKGLRQGLPIPQTEEDFFLTADALETSFLVDQLRHNEGAMLNLICDNPDFNNQPDAAIEICDDWTFYVSRRFIGDTMLIALRAALMAKMEKKPTTDFIQDMRCRRVTEDGRVSIPKADLDRLLDLLGGPL